MSIFLKLSNHPALLLGPKPLHTDYTTKYIAEILKFENTEELFKTENCGKLQVLEQILAELFLKKAKILLFSYSVKLLDILERFVVKKRYNHIRLDGATKNEQRQLLVNEFNTNNEIFIFLISTK